MPQATLRVLGRESINVNMAMAELLNSHGCVVEHSEQHRDREVGVYFQRAEFDWSAMRCSQESLQRALDDVCGRLELEYQLEWGTRPKRLSSGFDHLVVNEFLIPGGIIVGGKFLDSRINWGNAFWFNFIPVTIGSIVGAWFLVIPFWFVNKDGFWKRQEREAAAKAAKEEKVVEA